MKRKGDLFKMKDAVGRKFIRCELARDKCNPKNTNFLTGTRLKQPFRKRLGKITHNFSDNLQGFTSGIKRPVCDSGGLVIRNVRGTILARFSSLTDPRTGMYQLCISAVLSLRMLRHKPPSPQCTRRIESLLLRTQVLVYFS